MLSNKQFPDIYHMTPGMKRAWEQGSSKPIILTYYSKGILQIQLKTFYDQVYKAMVCAIQAIPDNDPHIPKEDYIDELVEWLKIHRDGGYPLDEAIKKDNWDSFDAEEYCEKAQVLRRGNYDAPQDYPQAEEDIIPNTDKFP